jgi:hypothetical protein
MERANTKRIRSQKRRTFLRDLLLKNHVYSHTLRNRENRQKTEM